MFYKGRFPLQPTKVKVFDTPKINVDNIGCYVENSTIFGMFSLFGQAKKWYLCTHF